LCGPRTSATLLMVFSEALVASPAMRVSQSQSCCQCHGTNAKRREQSLAAELAQ
jgi:hypothetical protein